MTSGNLYIVLLRFSDQKGKAGELMQEHMQWVEKGLADDVFGFVGSLPAGAGGCVLAYNITLAKLEERVAMDAFVKEGIVMPEILEISPSRVHSQFTLLSQ